MVSSCLLAWTNERPLVAVCTKWRHIMTYTFKLWEVELAETNTMCLGLHSKGILYSSRGPGKGWVLFKWDKLQGGDWHIPQSAKTEKLCSWNRRLGLIYRLTCWCWGHHILRCPKDTCTVYIIWRHREDRYGTSKHLTTVKDLCCQLQTLAGVALVFNLLNFIDAFELESLLFSISSCGRKYRGDSNSLK